MVLGLGLKKRNRTKREIIVNAGSLETRVAILENDRLEEFQVEHPTEQRVTGSVFKGKIQNLEHDLQAAFVNIGLKKNAFLHYWDMAADDGSRVEMEEGYRRKRSSRSKRWTNEEVSEKFPPGSDIVVQVTKGAIGTKGPRVTASLSIPGRYLVLMPGVKLKGVSRKIADVKVRQKLKKILGRLPIPQGAGLIMRTAATSAGKRAIARDLRGLVTVWEDLQRDMKEMTAPCRIYSEPDLVERLVRDWLTEDIDQIIVDSSEQYERIRGIAAGISRKARSRIQLYEGDMPVFDHYDIEQQLQETFRRKVGLPSGGCIVLDETEALIAIDVNTGKHKGKGQQEQAILDVNTEAVKEVARQLRLRNIGGLVVIDLIDMKSRKHQNSVFRTMKEALRRDRARTNILPISELGILEMTRQRGEESIMSSMYVDCPYCHGRGGVRSPLGMSVDIQRQIAAIMRRSKSSDVTQDLQIIIHPTVMDRLRREDEEFLMALESKFDGKLSFKSDPARHIEFFSINDAETGKVIYSSTER